VVFVYGGGEGSIVAAPIAGEILRYYFGLEKPEEEQQPKAKEGGEKPAAPKPAASGQLFRARLLGTEARSGEGAALAGYALDADGQGLTGVVIRLEAAGETLAELHTAADGSFAYDALDPRAIPELTLRLADYPQAEPLTLYITAGQRYLVQIEEIANK
jgi:hypothetical protein